jgi:transcriptional antiterminator RfaH
MPEEPTPDEAPRWYCLHAKTKAEHIAAAHLRQLEQLEVFCPRIRFPKVTARGKVWWSEALFPGYLFARFDMTTVSRAVRHAPSVRRIVGFGEKYPVVPDDIIDVLRSEIGEEEMFVVERPFESGEMVEVKTGPLRGLRGVITHVMPAKQRVSLLLEFLGQQRMVEMAGEWLEREAPPRDLAPGEFGRPGYLRKG